MKVYFDPKSVPPADKATMANGQKGTTPMKHANLNHPTRRNTMFKQLTSLFTAFIFTLVITSTACGGGGGGGNNNGGDNTDKVKPTVNLTAPTDGATVGGAAVVLSASANDNQAMDHVDFEVDGTTVCTASGMPFNCSWNSTSAANGNHTVTAVAFDAAGNVSTPSSVTITVHNTVLGCTWRPVPVPTTKRLNDVCVFASDNIWAVGDTGTLLHYNGIGWATLYSTGDTANFNKLSCRSPYDMWIAADNGVAIFGNGVGWGRTLQTGTTANFTSVWSAYEREVWMVKHTGGINRWDGVNWTSYPVYENFIAMWGSAQNNAWVVGFGGVMRHWNGTIWGTFPSNSTKTYSTIWGSGPNDIWAAGYSGAMMHFNGTAWSEYPSGQDTVSYTSIHGTSASDVWFLQGNGTMQHWDGTTLSVVRNGSETLRAIYAYGPTDVWAVGDNGVVLHCSP